MTITARRMTRMSSDLSRDVPVEVPVDLDPRRSAAVICDMWDRHWCRAAARRVAEMAPVANRLVTELRNRGVFIVHAPSDTLDRYRDHPARERALVEAAPHSGGACTSGLNDDGAWMRHDPACEAVMPIDDADGGCACSPRCAESEPWTSQIADIVILPDDVIADSAEVFRVYESRGIDTVIVLGVHTNMCVLGRPFGIRASVRRGYRTFLVRDLTDSMYNPARRPWVDHFTGTDLVVRHIETYWCPTFTSDQVLGGSEFRFAEDPRGR